MSSIPLIDPNKAAAELCRRSFSFFVKEFWNEIIPDELVWNWHLEVLCNEIEAAYRRVALGMPKLYDLIINIPPGTSKSTICTIMAPAWSWTIAPNLRHITGSYSATLSIEHSVKSRDIIQSDKYRKYFPEIQLKIDENNKTSYRNRSNGQRYTTSTGGTVTGVHAHIITIDDPLNPKQAASKVEIQGAIDWFDKTLSTRKVNKEVSVMVLVMQRLATNDPTGHLLDKKDKKIRHICLPGELSTHVKPAELAANYKDGLLDPLRLSRKALSELKTDLGSGGYAGQIMQTPVPDGGLIWQKWFIPVPDNKFPNRNLFKQYGTDWDLAYTKDEENAASAFVTGGKIKNDIFIDNIGWGWFEFPEMIKFMKQQPSPHYIEAKASGKSAKQALTKIGINAIEVKVAGGSDKVARAKMATIPAESGRVYVRESLLDKLYNDSKQGILFFPKGAFKDLADALAQFILRLNKSQINVSGSGSEEYNDRKLSTDELLEFLD